MPIGVLNVSIVDAATQGRVRFAMGIGIGGGIADTIDSAIAFGGVGRLLTAYPERERIMAIVAAVTIGGYALLRIFHAPKAESRARRGEKLRFGVVTGMLLTLPNPAALGAWIATAALLWPAIALGPALVLAISAGIGSAAWFILLARWIGKLPADHRVKRWMPRIALVLFVAIAIGGVVRVLS